jgi:hypothetical protein
MEQELNGAKVGEEFNRAKRIFFESGYDIRMKLINKTSLCTRQCEGSLHNARGRDNCASGPARGIASGADG